MVAGGLLIGGSLALLSQILSNPEEAVAAGWVANLFGGNIGTAVLGLLTGFVTGVSLVIHGLNDALDAAFGSLPSVVQGIFTDVELLVDSIQVTLAALTAVTTAAGVATLGAKLFVAGGSLASDIDGINNLITDGQVMHQEVSCTSNTVPCTSQS